MRHPEILWAAVALLVLADIALLLTWQHSDARATRLGARNRELEMDNQWLRDHLRLAHMCQHYTPQEER